MRHFTSAAAGRAYALLITIIAVFLSGKTLAATITPPTTYDNAGGSFSWGQTFVPELDYPGHVSGVQFYIGDPSRPGNVSVNELEGEADLVFFDISNPNSAVELGRTQVQGAAGVSAGLTTFNFSSSIAVNPGLSYFIGLDTVDQFGLGLGQQLASTYKYGFEAVIENGVVGFAGGGCRVPGCGNVNAQYRDTAFEVVYGDVSAVPLPAAAWIFISAIAGLAGAKRMSRPKGSAQSLQR